jgi:hypothetical protein
MKKVQIILGFLMLPILGFSQMIPDSVTIIIDNRIEVIIEFEDYSKLQENKDLEMLITNFQSKIPQFVDQLKLDESEVVTYFSDSLLSIEKGNPKQIFLMDQSQLINTGVRDKAQLMYKGLSVTISTNDLSILSEFEIMECTKRVMDSLPEKSKMSKSFFFQCIDGNVTQIIEKNRTNSSGDEIGLYMGTGVSLLKNTSLVDISFSADVIFLKKGLITHNAYFSANLMYDFTSPSQMNINTFINVGYRFNFSNKRLREDLFGVEFGYLVSRQGDLFDKNTFRLSFNKSIYKKIIFSPQLYMEDGFRKFYPGIRIGMAF